MKKLVLCFTLLALQLVAMAQDSKKYVLVEHFTNSWCPICASRNPTFYTTLAAYPNDVHHIAYHPPIPYEQCPFYQANTVENDARTSFYGIDGSPRCVLNGIEVPLGNALLPPAYLTAQLGLTSPVRIRVNESSGDSRTVDVKVKTITASPLTGNYRIFAALVEKQVDFNSPNGEHTHYNVFRKFLTSASGDPFTPAGAGDEVDFSYNYTIDNAWSANQIYTIVFIQDITSKEVLNSGTESDEDVTSAGEIEATGMLEVFPNPSTGLVSFRIPTSIQGKDAELEVWQSDGHLARREKVNTTGIFTLDNLATGTYQLRLTSATEVWAGKVVILK